MARLGRLLAGALVIISVIWFVVDLLLFIFGGQPLGHQSDWPPM